MHIHRLRTFAVVAATMIAAAACGSDASSGTGNQGGTPTRVDVTAAPPATGAAGTAVGAFAVKVADANGAGVPGITVTFSATGAAVVSPTNVVTDAAGAALTQVALSTATGAATVRASVSNVATAATASITVIAGATAKIVVTPKTLRFFNLGDTARIAASAQDQYGNSAGAGSITDSVVDGALVSVDQAGLVRVLRQPGTTLVISSSASKADTTTVTVLAQGATNCTGLATPLAMAVGDVQTISGAQYDCLSGAASGAEFAVVAFNSSADATNA